MAQKLPHISCIIEVSGRIMFIQVLYTASVREPKSVIIVNVNKNDLIYNQMRYFFKLHFTTN